MRRLAPLALLVLLAACTDGGPVCPPIPLTAAHDGVPYGQTWVGMGSNVADIEAAHDGVTPGFFDAPGSFVVDNGVSWNWPHAQRTAYFTSLADLQQAAADPAGLEDVDAVLYDPEQWDATPVEERRDPASAMRAFGDLADQLGKAVVITPGFTLPAVVGASCPQQDGETIEDAYLRCHVIGDAATAADVVEIQAQTLQSDPAAYRDFITAATAQARDANPEVVVLTGLRTHNEGAVPQARGAWAVAVPIVDGHYLSMEPDDAAQLLRGIQACADRG